MVRKFHHVILSQSPFFIVVVENRGSVQALGPCVLKNNYKIREICISCMKHFRTLEYEFHKSSCLGQNTGWHSSLTVNLDFSAWIPGEPVSALAAPASFHSS